MNTTSHLHFNLNFHTLANIESPDCDFLRAMRQTVHRNSEFLPEFVSERGRIFWASEVLQ